MQVSQLDRTYLSAWTLMGHEYVEMKNSHAAIEAYRKAVGRCSAGEFRSVLRIGTELPSWRCKLDVNRKDYRAWYGLAQAYELLSMHQYALYYYQHATALRWVLQPRCLLRHIHQISIRPYDVRIWQAQGMCYEEMGR